MIKPKYYFISILIIMILISVSVTESQQLHVIHFDPAKKLTKYGIDTTDYVRIRQVVDTTTYY